MYQAGSLRKVVDALGDEYKNNVDVLAIQEMRRTDTGIMDKEKLYY